MKNILKLIFLLEIMLITCLVSCGGGGGGSGENSKERLRLVNASSDFSAVDFTLGTDVLVEEVAYGESSGFVEAPEGKEVKLRVKSDLQVLPVLEKTIEIVAGGVYSQFFIGEKSSYSLVSVKESFPKNTGGLVSFRATNMSPTKTSVDVYVLVQGTEIEDSVPVYKALAYKSVSDYVQFDPGEYSIVYTEAGGTKEVRTVDAFQFEADRGYTHILLDKINGGTPLTSRIIEDF